MATGAIFFVLVLLLIFSLVPVPMEKGFRTGSLYIPLAAILLYIFYESMMNIELPPESVPIRIDLALIIPMLAVILVTGIVRWVTVVYLFLTKKLEDKKLAIRVQACSIIVAVLLAGIWFFTGF